MFTNNILNEEQMKQIEENSNKQINNALFTYNKSPIKTNEKALEIKTNNSTLDKLPNISNFSNDSKILNKIPQPKNNLNNVEDKNKCKLNSINIFNNPSKIIDVKNKFVSNSVNIIKDNNIENVNVNNNKSTSPKCPKSLNENNENNYNLKNENIINSLSNSNININSIKKIDNIFNKNSFIIHNPYNNFLSDYQYPIKRALNQFSFIPSLNNNCFFNPINNTFNHIFNFHPINIAENNINQNNNPANYIKKENNNIFVTKKKS